MALAYLQIFADKEDLLEPFDDAERGRLLTAMLAYALHDEEIDLTGNERYIWPVFRQMIDQSKCTVDAKRRAGQRSRISAPVSTPKQEEAEPITEQQKPAPASTPEQEEAKPQQPKAKRFTPPTVEDVKQYAAAQGYTLDAQRFVDFYASKGWMVGKSPMKDWQAAARGWAAKERAAPAQAASRPVKAVEQQRYEQREYVHTDAGLKAMMDAWKQSGGVS